ncbi:MAG: CHAT domain-containing tetratricopeptide repeat protein [Planctomycetota bacterium]
MHELFQAHRRLDLAVLIATALLYLIPIDTCSVLAQTQNPLAIEPALHPVFADDFTRDTRSDYQVEGDVTWVSNGITLSKGASVERTFDGGFQASLGIKVETEHTLEPQLRVRFLRRGANHCYLRFSWSSSGEQPASIALIETGIIRGEPFETLVRESLTDSLKLDSILVKYRRGLIQVLSEEGGELFIGYDGKSRGLLRGIGFQSPPNTASPKIVSLSAYTDGVVQGSPISKQDQAEVIAANGERARLTRQRDLSGAIAIGEKICELRKRIRGPDHPDYATSLEKLARQYYDLGDFSRAFDLLNQTIKIRQHSHGELHPASIASLNNLGVMHVELGNLDTAEELFLGVRDKTQRVLGSRAPLYSNVLNHLGAVHTYAGQYARAEQLLRQVCEIRKSLRKDAPQSFAASLYNLAELQRRIGDYVSADKLYREARDVQKAALGERHPDYANTLNSLAALQLNIGDHKSAIQILEEVCEITKPLAAESSRLYAGGLHNLATVHERAGDLTYAKQLHTRAGKLSEQQFGRQHPDYARSLLALGRIDKKLGEYASAEKLLLQAKDILESSLGDSHVAFADLIDHLADLYLVIGNVAGAEDLFTQARDIRRATLGQSHPSYAASLYSLAAVRVESADYGRAESLYREALSIQRDQLDRNSVIQSRRQQLINQREMRCYLDRMISHSLEMGKPNARQIAESVWRWKGSVTARQKAYQEVATNAQLVPLFKSLRSITQQLSVAYSTVPISPPKAASRTLQQNYLRRRTLWNERVSQLTREREQIQKQMARRAPEFRELQTPLSTAAIQSSLPQGSAFVDFLAYQHSVPNPNRQGFDDLQERYIAIVVPATGPVDVVALGSTQSVHEAIDGLRRGLTQAHTRDGRDFARELRRSIWVPLEEHLQGFKTVVISPDSQLGTLPFAALPGQTPGSFLIEEYQVVSIPFARLLKKLPESRQREVSHLLVVGDVNYESAIRNSRPAQQMLAFAHEEGRLNRNRGRGNSSHWTSLPGFRDELDSLTRLHHQRFGNAALVNVLSGANATEDRLFVHAKSSNTLHLVTHGFFLDPSINSIGQADSNSLSTEKSMDGPDPFFDKWRPGLLSGLVLAGANSSSGDPENLDDGILRAAEIEAWSLPNVDLVVLSACETGLGPVAGGEGLTGLQRAFHVAGARSVIASLWKVDDRATQELMRRFYTNLWIKKQSKIDALRNAQLWMLRHPGELAKLGVEETETRGAVRDRRKRVVAAQEEPARTSPFFWASFQLSGDWQ